MSYRRFKFGESPSTPATVATVATLRAAPRQTVANVASVAGVRCKTAILESLSEAGDAELEERKALAAVSVPERYLDGWVRLQCQQPATVTEAQWRQAMDAAGRFLDEWGTAEFDWTAGDLFDVPHGGKPGGLVWFLEGEVVRSAGPEHVVTISGRIFDRITRAEWETPYKQKAAPCSF